MYTINNKIITLDSKIALSNFSLKRNLCACWEFDDTNTVLLDSHAGINGAFGAGTQIKGVTGKIGTSILFTGATNNDYATVSDNAAFDNTGSFSFNVWLYQTSNLGNYALFASNVNFTNTGHLPSIFYASATNKWTAYVSDPTYSDSDLLLVDDTSPTLNDWVMYTVTCNGKTMYFYKNGNLLGTDSFATTKTNMSPVSLFIWARSRETDGRAYFKGKIDQSAYWKYTLPPEHVKALYNNGNGLAYTSWT